MRNIFEDNDRAREHLAGVSACKITTVVNPKLNKAKLVCQNSDATLATVSWSNKELNTTFKFRSNKISKHFDSVDIGFDCTSEEYARKLCEAYLIISDAYGRNIELNNDI